MRYVLVLLLVALAPGAAHARDLTVSQVGWPESTKSVLTKRKSKVYEKAKGKGDHLGTVAKGQRLAWKRIVKTKDKCKAWLELEPRGWLCAKDVKPSDDAPVTTEVVTEVKTGTEFVGIDLKESPPSSWPFAWALERRKWKKGAEDEKENPYRDVDVRAAASADAKVVRTLAPRALVAVLDTDGDFARIGDDEWVALADLRVAKKVARPDGIGDGERWIDVDLDQAVLIGYEGDTPVYATLVSSGRRNGTPTGIYRIDNKIAVTTIASGDHAKGKWRHPDTPFTMRFRHRYALHGAYWHDRFGNDGSMGCVNLAPEDARWIYDFVDPVAPAGWLEVRVADEDEGTPVQIRSKKDPTPEWKDYKGERKRR